MAGIINYIEHDEISQESRTCGYCKETSHNENYAMWAYKLTPAGYQAMIDRNWRRSGHYCYRPRNDRVCCPLYTIRCDATEFRLKKSHKKVIKNFNNFIRFGIKPNNSKENVASGNSMSHEASNVAILADIPSEPISLDVPRACDSQNRSSSKVTVIAPKADQSSSNVAKPVKQSKTKFKRQIRYIEKLMKRENCDEQSAKTILYNKARARNRQKSLEERLLEFKCSDSQQQHRFRTVIRLVERDSKSCDYLEQTEVYKKYQIQVHNDKPEDVKFSGFKRFLIDSPLEPESVSRRRQSYNELLKHAPMLVASYGSYHQLYYIDDRLIAVGVIDILPKCLSSVYLFYDPDYSFLNLGVYSSLTEIALVREYQRVLPEFRYYYMGFYIDSCKKMRYKAQYYPSYLLCSETFTWHPIEKCLLKLKSSKYSRFADENVADEKGHVTDNCVQILHRNRIILLNQIVRQLPSKEVATIREFARLVGRDGLDQMLYFLNSM